MPQRPGWGRPAFGSQGAHSSTGEWPAGAGRASGGWAGAHQGRGCTTSGTTPNSSVLETQPQTPRPHLSQLTLAADCGPSQGAQHLHGRCQPGTPSWGREKNRCLRRQWVPDARGAKISLCGLRGAAAGGFCRGAGPPATTRPSEGVSALILPRVGPAPWPGWQAKAQPLVRLLVRRVPLHGAAANAMPAGSVGLGCAKKGLSTVLTAW